MTKTKGTSASSAGLSRFGRRVSLLSILTPQEIEEREKKRLAIIGRHRSPLARQVELINRENVFAACVIVIYRAIEMMFGKQAAEDVISDCGYKREDLLRPEFRINIDIFNKIMAKARAINRHDPGSDFTIGQRVNQVRWGNVERLAGFLASPFIPVKMAFDMVPKGNEGFNITKDFIVRELKKTQAIIDMVIFSGIDPVWDDIFSRFFIMGIFSVIPHLWDMPDAQIEEIVLQYDVLDTLVHFRNESNRLGWGLKINSPHINDLGQLIINNDIYGKKLSEIRKNINEWQRIGMEMSHYGIDIEKLISNSPEAVYIYKDLLLRDGPTTGSKKALYLLREGQIYNATFTRYIVTWENPSPWNRAKLFFQSNLWRGSRRELLTMLKNLFRSEHENLVIREGDRLSQLRNQNVREIEEKISRLHQEKLSPEELEIQAKKWTQEFEEIGGATKGHVERVEKNSYELGKYLNLPKDRLELLRVCAGLHDLGKTLIPRDILEKKEKPNDREFWIIQSHAETTGVLLRLLGIVGEEGARIAESHHEKLDGSGYHKGLKGDQIPFESRIITVIDSFDAAVASDRRYKEPKTWLEVAGEFQEDVDGRKLDRAVVKAFLEMLINKGYWIYSEVIAFCPFEQRDGIQKIIEEL